MISNGIARNFSASRNPSVSRPSHSERGLSRLGTGPLFTFGKFDGLRQRARNAFTPHPFFRKTGRPGMSNTTTDHDTIRKWAEKHGGKPAAVKRTHKDGDTGIIRLEFPKNPN